MRAKTSIIDTHRTNDGAGRRTEKFISCSQENQSGSFLHVTLLSLRVSSPSAGSQLGPHRQPTIEGIKEEVAWLPAKGLGTDMAHISATGKAHSPGHSSLYTRLGDVLHLSAYPEGNPGTYYLLNEWKYNKPTSLANKHFNLPSETISSAKGGEEGKNTASPSLILHGGTLEPRETLINKAVFSCRAIDQLLRPRLLLPINLHPPSLERSGENAYLEANREYCAFSSLTPCFLLGRPAISPTSIASCVPLGPCPIYSR